MKMILTSLQDDLLMKNALDKSPTPTKAKSSFRSGQRQVEIPLPISFDLPCAGGMVCIAAPKRQKGHLRGVLLSSECL
jgi:hypothetical protein